MTVDTTGPDSVGRPQVYDPWVSDGPLLDGSLLVDMLVGSLGWVSYAALLLAALGFIGWALSASLRTRRGEEVGLPAGAIGLAIIGVTGIFLPGLMFSTMGVEQDASPAPDPAPAPKPAAGEEVPAPAIDLALDLDAAFGLIGKGLLWIGVAIGALMLLGVVVAVLAEVGAAANRRVEERRERRVAAALAVAEEAAALAAERERLANLTAYEIVMEGLPADVRAAIERATAPGQVEEAPPSRRRRKLRAGRGSAR